jgi:hypothetical protein
MRRKLEHNTTCSKHSDLRRRLENSSAAKRKRCLRWGEFEIYVERELSSPRGVTSAFKVLSSAIVARTCIETASLSIIGVFSPVLGRRLSLLLRHAAEGTLNLKRCRSILNHHRLKP